MEGTGSDPLPFSVNPSANNNGNATVTTDAAPVLQRQGSVSTVNSSALPPSYKSSSSHPPSYRPCPSETSSIFSLHPSSVLGKSKSPATLKLPRSSSPVSGSVTLNRTPPGAGAWRPTPRLTPLLEDPRETLHWVDHDEEPSPPRPSLSDRWSPASGIPLSTYRRWIQLLRFAYMFSLLQFVVWFFELTF